MNIISTSVRRSLRASRLKLEYVWKTRWWLVWLLNCLTIIVEAILGVGDKFIMGEIVEENYGLIHLFLSCQDVMLLSLLSQLCTYINLFLVTSIRFVTITINNFY